jgi:hypothetical protein
MQINIAIQPTPLGGFRAESAEPFKVVVEGSTREEAVAKIRVELNKQIEGGKEPLIVEVGTIADNPWLKLIGRQKDNPLFDEWRAEVEAYRRQCDIDAGVEYKERP